MEMIPAWVGDQLTPWSIVFIVILLIITGGLHTNRAMKAKEREAEYWRDAFMIEQKTNHKLSESISEQEIVSKSFEKFMGDLQQLLSQRSDGGGDSS